jgi:cell division protein FtsB
MSKKLRFLLTAAVLFLVALFFFIVVSDDGLKDVASLRKEQARLRQHNKRLSEENLTISVEIERLKYDPAYIENIARQELGMIGAEEFILKPRKKSDFPK